MDIMSIKKADKAFTNLYNKNSCIKPANETP